MALTFAPQLKLSDAEGHELAKAIGNVARHYDVSATEKSMDIMALLMVASSIYGPRAVSIVIDAKTKKSVRVDPMPSPNNVTPIRPVAPQAGASPTGNARATQGGTDVKAPGWVATPDGDPVEPVTASRQRPASREQAMFASTPPEFM